MHRDADTLPTGALSCAPVVPDGSTHGYGSARDPRNMVDDMSSSRYGTLVLVCTALIHVQCTEPVEDRDVVATVGGHKITVTEVDRRWQQFDPASRIQAQQQIYEGRARTLNQLIGERLIELEARAKGMVPEQLIRTEITKRVEPVTEADVVSAYRAAGDQARGMSLEQARPRIREYLEQQRSSEAARAFFDELTRRDDRVVITLDPPRLDVRILPTDPARGPLDAPVTIVEFSDFQCPFCKQALPTLQRIQTTFGDQVRQVYRHSPLPNHAAAFAAAAASDCAHEQGRFWPYHDLLFANYQTLEPSRLKEYARAVGLDAKKFDACFDSGKSSEAVVEDLEDAQRYGVASTPTFFVNGRMVLGAVSYEALEQIVREELDRAQSR
jgi:protein-disulfide isomerase